MTKKTKGGGIGDFGKDTIFHGLFTVGVLILPIILYFVAKEKNVFSTFTYLYACIFMLFFILLLSAIIFLGEHKINAYIFMGILLVICIVSLFMYIYSKIVIGKISASSQTYLNYGFEILGICILIVGLATIYPLISNNIANIPGIPGFIINLIFFIPCLLTDFLEYLKYEFSIIPNVTLVLLCIEIILILGYVFLPSIVERQIEKGATVLLPKYEYLNKKNIIAHHSDLSPIEHGDSDPDNPTSTALKNYAFTMWIYVNQQNPTLKDKNIFTYGQEDGLGKPRISYNNKYGTDKYTFSFTNSNHVANRYELALPIQKWNYIVFNYNFNKSDLFLNGTLEKSFTFNNSPENRLPEYALNDAVIIGDNNGLNGAICNVSYYNKPLTMFQITNIYNILMNNNPPINNIL